jgi:hypothetical protein
MPRLKTDTVGTGDQSWLASLHAVREARSGTLDTSAFTKATHYPNGYFISGLPLGQITATKLYAPYNSGAADGTQTLAGFLVFDVPTDGVEDLNAAILDHGRIYTDKLPIAGITAATATSGQFVMLTKGAGA